MLNQFDSGAVSILPAVPSAPSLGYATSAGAGTVIGHTWINMVTMEIMNAVTSGGITPSAADFSQLAKSITNQITNAINNEVTARNAAIVTAINAIKPKYAQLLYWSQQ